MLISVGCEKGIKNQTKVFNKVVVGFGFEKQLFLLGIALRMECSVTDIRNVCQTREMEIVFSTHGFSVGER